jgi:hypothetical protein
MVHNDIDTWGNLVKRELSMLVNRKELVIPKLLFVFELEVLLSWRSPEIVGASHELILRPRHCGFDL